MKRFRHLVGIVVACAVFSIAGITLAQPPETSLNNCQNAARSEAKKYLQNSVNAVGICLAAVAKNVIKSNVAISPGTASTCVAQFRKLNDTRVPPANKGLAQRLTDKVDFKCDPVVNPLLTHTFADIKGMLGGTLEDVNAVNIDIYCSRFGGDGSIDTVAEWEACLTSSHRCEMAAAIATQFPRAAEWMADLLLAANMPGVVPPASDPTRTTDAVAGATAFKALLDPDGDDISNVLCGGAGVACSTACCYAENVPPVGPETTCYQYTATGGQVGAFIGGCFAAPTSVPGGVGLQIRTGVAAPCFLGPTFGTPCLGFPNLHILPTDSACLP